MTYYIKKSSGKKEEFNVKKFRRSLNKAGADEKTIEQILEKIKKEKPKSTRAIHEITLDFLDQFQKPIAARYNLKRALMDFGPAGYPFELFVAALLKKIGYTTQTNQIVQGKCVQHEVDIIAHKENEHYLVECKFHNRPGLKTDVKAALYIEARFLDIKHAWEKDPQHKNEFHQAWMVTNTQFTKEARKYGECENMRLISWNYPKDNGLAHLIDQSGLHPITALTSLSKKQKRAFIQEGFVLCKDAEKHTMLLKKFGFSDHKIQQLIAETKAVCGL